MSSIPDLRDKYRPRHFRQLAQGLPDPTIRAITMALASGRLPQAFLLRGQYGCSKTTVARLLGLRAVCLRQELHPYEPCGQCEHCRSVRRDPRCAGWEGYCEYDVQSQSPRELIDRIMDQIIYNKAGGKIMPHRVVALDEFHRLPVRDQEKFVKVIEDGAAMYRVLFVICAAPGSELCPAIQQRCTLRPIRPPAMVQGIHHVRTIARAEGRTLNSADAKLLVATANRVPRVYLDLLQDSIILSGDSRIVTREVVLHVCEMSGSMGYGAVKGEEQ
jgi:DNA polymerase III gamma/tau subunit